MYRSRLEAALALKMHKMTCRGSYSKKYGNYFQCFPNRCLQIMNKLKLNIWSNLLVIKVVHAIEATTLAKRQF